MSTARHLLVYSLAGLGAAIAGYALTLAVLPPAPATREMPVQTLLSPAPQADIDKLVVAASPVRASNVTALDNTGTVRRLAEWRGRPVILNLWATWCPPCREEMPMLDRMAAAMPDVAVLALSVDRSGIAEPAAFLARLGITQLTLLNDASGATVGAFNAGGLPATIVLDAEGHEIARLVGPAKWDAPAMIARLRDIIAAAAP